MLLPSSSNNSDMKEKHTSSPSKGIELFILEQFCSVISFVHLKKPNSTISTRIPITTKFK